METHLQRYGQIFRLHNGQSITHAHENPFSSWSTFALVESAYILWRCRDKETTYVQGQPYIVPWNHVPSNLSRVYY